MQEVSRCASWHSPESLGSSPTLCCYFYNTESISPCCCCCCWIASVVSDSVRPHRWQPTRLPRPWDFPGKNTGVGCHFFSNAWKWKLKVKSLSRIRLLATPWTAAYQAPPSMVFSRQEYWSVLPAGAGALPMAKVMRKEAQHTQRRDRTLGVPLEILEHLPPKPESAYFLLCALTYTSDFMGGCPLLPLSEKKS